MLRTAGRRTRVAGPGGPATRVPTPGKLLLEPIQSGVVTNATMTEG